MTDILSIERFQDLIASYGADPQRWPAHERAGAVRRLVDSDAARTAWREAAALDEVLDSGAAPQTTPGRVDEIVAMGRAAAKPGRFLLLNQMIPYAAAAAVALVVGLAVPSPLRDAPAPAQSVGSPIAAATAPSSPGNELTALALIDAETVAVDDGSAVAADDADLNNSLSALPLL